MSTVINTNIKSLMAANALTVNGRNMRDTMQSLSTGSRINGAADDAAGLSIRENMTSQIRGLNAAVRNANDAISMLQTADGAMEEQTVMMQRMRELGVLAQNDTCSALAALKPLTAALNPPAILSSKLVWSKYCALVMLMVPPESDNWMLVSFLPKAYKSFNLASTPSAVSVTAKDATLLLAAKVFAFSASTPLTAKL